MAKIYDITKLIDLNRQLKAIEKEKEKIYLELIARGDGIYEGTEHDVLVKGGKIIVIPKKPKPTV